MIFNKLFHLITQFKNLLNVPVAFDGVDDVFVEVREVVHGGVVAQGALALLAAKVPVEALAVAPLGLAVVVAKRIHAQEANEGVQLAHPVL